MTEPNTIVIPKKETFDVDVCSVICKSTHMSRPYDVGQSIQHVMDSLHVPKWTHGYIGVTLNDGAVPLDMWPRVRPSKNTTLQLTLSPAAGKSTSQARQIAAILANVGGNLIGSAIGGFWGRAIGIGLGIWGQAIAVGLFPPAPDSDEESFLITGAQNQIKQYGIVPKVYGKARIYPNLAAIPIMEVRGGIQYINMIFLCGFAPARLTDLRLGELSLGDLNSSGEERFIDYSIEVSTGWGSQRDELTLYTKDTDQKVLNEELRFAPDWDVIRGGIVANRDPNVIGFQTEENTNRISIDLLFPTGLGKYEDGDWDPISVGIKVRYRLLGSTTQASWVNIVSPDSFQTAIISVNDWNNNTRWSYRNDFNDVLDSIITDMESVPAPTRVTSTSADLQIRQTIIKNNRTQLEIEATETLTAGQQDIFDDTDALYVRLLVLLDSAKISFLPSQGSFNDGMSDSVVIVQSIDQLDVFGRYQRTGIGPNTQNQPYLASFVNNRSALVDIFGQHATDEDLFIYQDISSGQFWEKIQWNVPVGQYEVEVRRATQSQATLDADSPDGSSDFNDQVALSGIQDKVFLFTATSYSTSNAISEEALEKYAYISLLIKATDQITGQIDRFNCISETPISYHESGDWQDPAFENSSFEEVYRNPAWIYADILRGNANGRPSADAQIDTDRLEAFAANNELNGYKFDYAFDQKQTLQKALQTVTRVGKGSPHVRDGKHSVVYDFPQNTSVALLCLRNTSGFRVRKTFDSVPDAIRVTFTDENQDYQKQEIIAYADGFGPGEAEAVRIEDVTFPGVTNNNHAAILARYLMALPILRPEEIQVEMDWEYFLGELGDVVDVRNDITKWGLGEGRVTGSIVLSGDDLVSCDLDELVTMESGKTYEANIRTADNVEHLGILVTNVGSSRTITFLTALDLDGSTVEVQNLTVWGEIGLSTTSCLIKEIRPRTQGDAQILLVESAPDVHTSGKLPEYDPRITQPPRPEVAEPPQPRISIGASDESVMVKLPSGTLQARIEVRIDSSDSDDDWEQRALVDIESYEIQYRLISRRIPVGTDAVPFYITLPNITLIGNNWKTLPSFSSDISVSYVSPVSENEIYSIRARSKTVYGVYSRWSTSQTATVEGKVAPPPQVGVIQLFERDLIWSYESPPIDLDGFVVRHFAGDGGNWSAATSTHEGVLKTQQFRIPEGLGGIVTFFIKAIDVAGHRSRLPRTIIFDLGQNPTGVRIGTFDHRANGWPGTILNMTEAAPADNFLEADAGDKTGFYGFGTGTFYASSGNAEPFYGSAFKEASYTFTHTVIPSELPYRLGIETIIGSGEDWSAQVKDNATQLWPDEFDQPQWEYKMEGPYWPSNEDWVQYKGSFDVEEDVSYQFRLIADGSNTQFIIEDVIEIRDRPKVVESIGAFSVAGAGTVRLPITKTFDTIESVQLTIEGGGTAFLARALDKVTTIGAGPSVECYDASGSRVAGVVSATIEGY